ncbi:Hemerythrin-like domain-containing protein [Desulfatibacillum alkenivorans DSM 16219]|jgi:hemerythrin-like domain-containing protein|uniref:Hemerythrin-like domain-containing protein n=2 Tax=Desulfatibacillum alkenivorans TaxID=259354 RepID=A0A1M7A191_9BACT|nr:Hemerythrin-like domain-containing protein [Desulfatibacillum alkenivorans DSM 16219]
MIEHRLIERMLEIVRREISSMKDTRDADPVFIDTVVDFVRTYADRTHHGKEEDILFKELAGKKMSASDQALMEELVEEHKFGRKTVKALVDAKNEYAAGNREAVSAIIEQLEILARFYPEHIRKEDKVFFPSTEKLFSQEEQDAMLEAFGEFDRKMIHEKYAALVEQLKR